MEIFSPEFFSALLAIIIIDLVLAGDNAIVIALAARNLPEQLRRRAILWGTAGAIGVRAAMTAIVVWLLTVPGLMFAGGFLLLWIAYRLLVPSEAPGGDAHGAKAAASLGGDMGTIVLAESLDDVLLQAQLRLFMHAAASTVEGGKIDGDRLFSEDRRESERFSVNGQDLKVRGGLPHNGRAHCFAIDPGRIGLANLRGVVDITLELAGHEFGDKGYTGLEVLLR